MGVEAEQGSTLTALANGAVLVEADGKPVTTIPPAVALDASGAPVAVSMAVEGDLLVLEVQHRSGQYQYPIDVDPTAVDYNDFEEWEGQHNWVYATNASNVFEPEWDMGFDKLTVDNGEYPYNRNAYDHGDYASWFYVTQGISRIYKFEADGEQGWEFGSIPGSTADAFIAIVGSSGAEDTEWHPPATACAKSGCPSSGGSAGNAALFELIATQDGDNYIWASLQAAYVMIAQDQGAAITFNTTDPEINGKPNALYQGGQWVASDGKARIEFSAVDSGLGVSFASLNSPGYGQWNGYHSKSPPGCIGVQCDPSYSVDRPVGDMLEGERPVRAYVANAAVDSELTQYVKVDNASPDSSISGLGSNNVADLGGNTLEVHVTDGQGSTKSSGLPSQASTVWLDGEQILAPGGEACSPGPCGHLRKYSFVGREVGVGEHTLKVTAVDQVGNESTQEFPIVIQGTGPRTDLGPGELNIKNGNFTLSTTDVAESTVGGQLTVSRTHESLRLPDSASPLGPSWQLSLGAWRSARGMPDGTTALIDSKGNQVIFQPSGGGYQAPPGYEGWELTHDSEKDTYSLIGPDKGITRFAHEAKSLYAPSSITSPGGKQTTQLSFGYYPDGILRPHHIYAPNPPGMSYCSPEEESCKHLQFRYADSTTATGSAPTEWGSYEGRLSSIELIAWDGAFDHVFSTLVEYAYDSQGRLRAVWDPRISPALKTTYGYDADGHVTAVSEPGQQPWLMRYGNKPGSVFDDWLLSITRPRPEAKLGESGPPQSTEAPHLGGDSPVPSVPQHVWPGAWDGDPIDYEFQWERCDAEGEGCAPIPSADGQSYTPKTADLGATLRATVTVSNAAGSTDEATEPSAVVSPAGPPEFELEFGSFGTELEQFNLLAGIALDAEGDVWLTDAGNNRVLKYSADGEFIAAYGSQGSGPGQFESPLGIAIKPQSGNVLVVDSGNDRVQELSPEGEFIQAWGSTGTGDGQFETPTGVAVTQFSGDTLTYVSDTGNDRVQAFWPGSEYIGQLGSTGSGPEQFNSPVGIAAIGAHWYVVDSGNDRVQEFEDGLVRTIGGSGSGPGQFNEPNTLAIEPNAGGLLTTEIGWQDWRVQKFSLSGAYVGTLDDSGLASGQLHWPHGVAAADGGAVFVLDGYPEIELARVSKWMPQQAAEGEVPSPPLESGVGEAVWSVAYDVPLGGPETLDPGEAESVWGQQDLPSDATAIFPPDEVPSGGSPSSYKRATVHYFNEDEQIVNVQAPGGRVSTEEHDQFGNVTRTLTPENRARVLEAESGQKALSEQLDTRLFYSENGSRLNAVLSPQRAVALQNGEEVEARPGTQYFYDEGAPPEGLPYGLVTKQIEGAWFNGETHDARVKTFDYDGQEGLGWELGEPTSETVDPGGLNLTFRTLYDPDTAAVIETRMPANPEGGDAHATQTIYYQPGESAVEECGERPDLTGLVCQTRPAAQPETPGLPDLPVTTTEYNIYHQPTVTTEVAGESARTATIEYDDAGRPTSTSITAGTGKPLPTVNTLYDEETGLPTVQSTETEAIVHEYDSLGRLTSYTDADGNTSTFDYDTLGRPVEVHDGKGTQTFTYDETTGDLAKVEDSAAGAFTAEYDAGGKVTSFALPNGLQARYTYDSGGGATALKYVDTTECSEECTWFEDEAVASIHGETLSQTSSLADFNYAYDAAGRLVEAQETPQGKGCTTRLYAYDADTNRTGMTTREPAEGGDCAGSGGETQTNAFDEADRLLGEGVTYDDFGNVTELPGAYAGGQDLTSTYYADDSAASLTQDGVTIEYMLDPMGRERESITLDGEGESSLTSHFSGEGDSPTWTEDGSGNWTRYIGAMGGLSAIQSSTEGLDLQIADLSGDIVATAEPEEAEELDFIGEATEYGEPQGEGPPAKYSWLGSAQRPVELDSGVINMGARTYVPQLGRFLQTDPIPGGSANAYSYVHGDPVGESDPSGEYTPSTGAPSWLREVMENPPGMPPPPPSPPQEMIFSEELSTEQAATGASDASISGVPIVCTFKHGKPHESSHNSSRINAVTAIRCIGGPVYGYVRTRLYRNGFWTDPLKSVRLV